MKIFNIPKNCVITRKESSKKYLAIKREREKEKKMTIIKTTTKAIKCKQWLYQDFKKERKIRTKSTQKLTTKDIKKDRGQ